MGLLATNVKVVDDKKTHIHNTTINPCQITRVSDESYFVTADADSGKYRSLVSRDPHYIKRGKYIGCKRGLGHWEEIKVSVKVISIHHIGDGSVVLEIEELKNDNTITHQCA